MITVSVIIPSKNRIEYTSQALDSIYNQKIPRNYKLEVIVVDDLSSPTLKSVLGKKYKNVRFVRNEKTIHGPGSSRNLGLKYATGDYVAFLDNDDQWKGGFLMTSLNVLSNSVSPAVLSMTEEYFDGEFSLNYKIKIKLLNIVRFVVLASCYFVNNKKLPKSAFYIAQISHMIFRRSAIKGLGFNELSVAAEDWEFVANSTLNSEILIIPKKLVKFRYEPKSNTQSEVVKKSKWNAYKNLLNRLPESHKNGVFYYLFLKYIRIFQ